MKSCSPYLKPGIPRNPIERLICHHHQVTMTELRQKNRKRKIVEARAVYISLIVAQNWKMYNEPRYTDIAEMLNKDHSTMIHSVKNVYNLMRTDSFFREKNLPILKNLDLEISDLRYRKINEN